ncbi:DUF5623 domain-containing protein [Pseudomonas sp. GWSMS-1]|uniref:DUF5623 domain-containing protein n=1 Tax=Pseudomonas sp. GWSMS-1 TaxID=3308997 RepID=UPI003CEC46FE
MSQSYTPPSTLSGISRFAKKLRNERGIAYKEALEVVARIAGFENHAHAKRQLADRASPLKLVPLYLTVYWHDQNDRKASGRCTAVVRLPEENLATLPTLKARGYWMLGGFQLESADHLQAMMDGHSYMHAQKRITDAVRDLQFCTATGLKPIRNIADKRRIEFLQDLPGQDHRSNWISPSGSWLALDEPYHPRSSEKGTKRGDWLAKHGLGMTAPAWGGLYVPGESIPYLISDSPELLQRVTMIVEGLPPLPQIDWDTHSSSYWSDFHSPLRIASGKPYRPRPQPSYGKRAGALPYGGRPGETSEWRPATAMSLQQHRDLGFILRGFSWSNLSSRVLDKLSSTISTLDDWANYEHSNKASDQIDRLYYGADRAKYATLDDLLKGVNDARALILSGYLECRPRRNLMKVLDLVERDAIKRAQKQVA